MMLRTSSGVLVLVGLMATSVVGAEGVQSSREASTQASANLCVVGGGLGATLLFPYFEVDLDDLSGITTLISVNNGLDSPGLARLVMWTDWGVPTLAFDIYLREHDIQTINLRSIFDGIIPSTGASSSVAQYPFCSIFPPYHENPVIVGDRTEHLRAAHTGRPRPNDGLCSSAEHGDSIARGYITVDSVNLCGGIESLDPKNTPANPAIIYFEDDQPTAIANNSNFLWGDSFFIDDRNNAAQGAGAVSLWADSYEFRGSGFYTFYGRFGNWDGRDDRVPLSNEWVQRYLNGGAFHGGADLIVFRHPNNNQAQPRSCDSPPSWFPLVSTITTEDEESSGRVTHQTDFLGLVTQRVSIGDLEPPPSSPFGLVWIEGVGDQLWVQPVLTGLGRFGVGLNGTPVGTLCDSIPPTMPAVQTTAAPHTDDFEWD